MNDDVQDFIKAALEASIYCEPADHGLTHDEIHEACAQEGYRRGEVDDALRRLRTDYDPETTTRRRRLAEYPAVFATDFFDQTEPDFRDPNAFEFVLQELREVARTAGASSATMPRRVLVGRGVAAGLPERDVEIAIVMLALVGRLNLEPKGVVRLTDEGRAYALPHEQIKARGEMAQRRGPAPRHDRPQLRRAYAIVKDLVARRTDNRPASPDPLRAMEAELDALGYPQFKIWWNQQLAEIELLDDARAPTAVTVLCAALCEGALVFVVDRAQRLAKTMGSKGVPPGEYKKWKFDDLIVGARQSPDPIFDQPTSDRCMDLNKIRQRIHAGRLISEPKSMTYDARPEEATRARETLKLATRRVLEWLQRNRSPSPAPE